GHLVHPVSSQGPSQMEFGARQTYAMAWSSLHLRIFPPPPDTWDGRCLGRLTVYRQVQWLAAADADGVPHLALVGTCLLPADAMPGQHPAIGGHAQADGNWQSVTIEEPADLSGAGAATDETKGIPTLHQRSVVGHDRGRGQDLYGRSERQRGRGGAPPVPGQEVPPSCTSVPPSHSDKEGLWKTVIILEARMEKVSIFVLI
ncbi:mCG145998, partial [Mus musculus]